MFNIDFIFVIRNLLPPSLRKPKLISWLRLITSNLYSVYLQFVEYRAKMLYDINFTGQLMYLEKKLQEVFLIPGIIISDGELIELVYLSNQMEGFLPVYLNNNMEDNPQMYLVNILEVTDNADFIVNVPSLALAGLTTDEILKMKKIINYYLLLGKSYKIQSHE